MSTYNKNSGYGRAMFDAIQAAVPGFGRVFVVMSTSDATEERYQRISELFGTDSAGAVRFFTDVEDAYDATTSNNNDVILLDGDTTFSLSNMLTVSKSRVHFIGLDWLLGVRRRVGQSTKISLGVTTAASDIGTIKVTGVRTSFRGIKFMNSNTVDQGIYCFVDAGEYTYIEDCEIYKSTDLDVTGAAELVANGDSAYYKNCWIGSTANEIVGAILRPCVLVTGEIVSGAKARDVIFEGCVFARKCGNSGNRLVYGANATDVERLMWFKDCLFYNNLLASADPAQAIAFGSSQTEGSVVLQGCATVSCTKPSTTTGVFIADAASNAAGGLVTQAS